MITVPDSVVDAAWKAYCTTPRRRGTYTWKDGMRAALIAGLEAWITWKPAALIVHWPTGPVFCCIEHGEKLLSVGKFMGAHVHVEPYNGNEPCTNCINEAKTVKSNG